jgi:threonine/homoserine/homoserine lactone efflux protein
VRLLDAALMGYAAAAAPGPFQTLLLERSVRVGVRRALPLSLVPLVSDPIVVVTCLFALSSVPPLLLRALGGAGGLLLGWMGISALRGLAGAASAAGGAEVAAPRARADGFWRAALVNLLNPNAWLFWSLVGGPMLAEAARGSAGEVVTLLSGFYVALTITNAALAAAFGVLGGLGPRVRTGLTVLSGAAFLGLGAVQLSRAVLGA